MPANGDTIRIKVISEMQGVSMTNLLYFEIDDIGTNGPVRDQLVSFGAQMIASVEDRQATDWAITCLIYKNIFGTDPQVSVFTDLPGTAINTPHPPQGVVRFNKYANDVGQLNGKHGAFNLSGTQITTSNKGRVASVTNFADFTAFLKGPLTLDTDGWTITPQLRWLLAAGPPKVFAYDPLILVRVSTRYNILQSRRSKLCRIG